MGDLEAALADNRADAERFIAALDGTASHWAVPVRPGKWSPAEVSEHIRLSYKEGAQLARGDQSGFPRAPAPLRPIIRLFFRRILKRGTFPKSRTFKSLTPLAGAPDPTVAADAIRTALADCEAAFRALRGPLAHPAFGAVDPADYMRFLGYHTRHHQGQLRP